tara:strand:- start:15245 stop:15631 length:387 start_codon:yes stop_codon:yes gene_type:complete
LFILSFISFFSNAIVIDNAKEEIVDVCPEKSIVHKVTTDKQAFLEKKDKFFLFKNLNTSSENYTFQLFGIFKSVYEDQKNPIPYYFIKGINLKDNKEVYINIDVLTGDPALNKEDILNRIKEKICSKN